MQEELLPYKTLVAGQERSYWVRLPRLFSTDKQYALLFLFHGSGGTGPGMEQLSHMGTLTEQKDVILVLPNGIDKKWNDGRPKHNEDIDDIAFVDAMLSELEARYPIEKTKIYAAGFSNGGLFSFRLACDRSEIFRKIAALGANMGEVLSKRCNPTKLVSVLHITGTKDPLMPFEGGEIQVPFSRQTRGRVLSAVQSSAFWATLAGCRPQPTIRHSDEKDDGTVLQQQVYESCQSGVQIESYFFENAGHTWPGGWQYIRESIIGKTSQERDASQLVLSFFQDSSGE